MRGEKGSDRFLGAVIGTVTQADTGAIGVAYGGIIVEAGDPSGLAPAVGDSVLILPIPDTKQWVILGTL